MREALRQPRPRPEHVAADTSEGHLVANRLAQAEAMADFMESSGEEGGFAAVEYVLRRWGERGQRLSTAPQLGTLFEWPPSLAGTRQRFETLQGRVDGLDARLEGLAVRPDGAATGEQLARELESGLRAVLAEIERATDFQLPRAKLEMSQVVFGLLTRVGRSRRRLSRMVERAASLPRPASEQREGAATATGGPPAPRAAIASVVPVAPEPRERLGEVQERMEQLRRQLGTAKDEERRHLGAARALLPRRYGGVLGAGFFDVFREDPQEAIAHLRVTAETLRPWIESIRRLRQAYRELGVPQEDWVVKPSQGDAPRQLDPDIDALVALYRGANRVNPINAGLNNIWGPIADQWLALKAY
jgi:hypothetical protein